MKTRNCIIFKAISNHTFRDMSHFIMSNPHVHDMWMADIYFSSWPLKELIQMIRTQSHLNYSEPAKRWLESRTHYLYSAPWSQRIPAVRSNIFVHGTMCASPPCVLAGRVRVGKAKTASTHEQFCMCTCISMTQMWLQNLDISFSLTNHNSIQISKSAIVGRVPIWI